MIELEIPVEKIPYIRTIEGRRFKDGKWIRISGELVEDDRREVKTLMLDKMPILRNMYNEDDGNMQMLYFKKAEVTISSFTSPQEKFEI